MRKAAKEEKADLWTTFNSERDKKKDEASSSSSNSSGGDANVNNATAVFVGDASSGKSTIIQMFLSSKNTKEAKATVALDYNFARKTANGVKSVGHIWEVGGDLVVTPQLMEIGVSANTFLSSTIVITCDLSKPFNVLSSLLRNITAVRELTAKRSKELQSTNVNALNAQRDKQLACYSEDHPDSTRTKLCEVPLIIVGTKFDTFKNLQSAERKSIAQVLRFVAHYYSASLYVTDKSTGESSLSTSLRTVITTAIFPSPLKPQFETNPDKPPYIAVSRGQDSFTHILTQTQIPAEAKSRLVADERDVDQYVTSKGVSKQCWTKMQEHMTALFGEPDPAPTTASSSSGSGGMETGEEKDSGGQSSMQKNPFPEAEIDSVRALKDMELQRLMTDTKKREDLQAKIALTKVE
jgi:dynein light intermediate chain 2